MSQMLRFWDGDVQIDREMPDANAEVIAGVRWGEPWVIFTPAYWISQFWMHKLDQAKCAPYQARGSLAEELVFCMLGGYGVTAELATSAFEACRESDLIATLETSPSRWLDTLQVPLSVNGRTVRYRYPNQKAGFLAGAMKHLQSSTLDNLDGRALRDELLRIKGVGPKTAGWVARNYLDTDDVAILDIHLIRAGQLCNVFSLKQKVERDYAEMECRFIDFCHALDARPAILDCLIWDQMRSYGNLAITALNQKRNKTPAIARKTDATRG